SCACGSSEFTKEWDNKRRCEACYVWRSYRYGTIFHNVRFTLPVAFELLRIYTESQNINKSKVARDYNVTRRTLKAFIKKLSNNEDNSLKWYELYKSETETKSIGKKRMKDREAKLSKYLDSFGKNETSV
ncbi:MAG: hypothetical protein OQJ83_05935, partial [Altibacter sp.]|nr:hypothetical protein [Altibacter sp.]